MKDGLGAATGSTGKVRAAQYLRASTEAQKSSLQTQRQVIDAYAAAHGIEIVRTYADDGKSGLLSVRRALTQLLTDVQSGEAPFDIILVQDISRWGRFQDADQGAYYEFLCREAGVPVRYCGEPFANDGSPEANIFKSVKRAMAGEFSRELSANVFASQCRMSAQGFRQGGAAGFGLRRQLLDESRQPKTILKPGQRKSIQTDRVILTPGPLREVDVVRRIYREFVLLGRSETEIASGLNAQGIETDFGRLWTRSTVHQILTNEKYIGNNVYNRVSAKLHRGRVVNPTDKWVRSEGAFEAVVDADFFEAARRIVEDRSRRFSDAQLLEKLAALFSDRGWLSGLIIDEIDEMPSSSVYRRRFGSLLRAYKLVGFSPDRDYRYIEANRILRARHPDAVARAVGAIERMGGEVRRNGSNDLLVINEEFSASIVIVRCGATVGGGLRWNIRLDTGLRPDITVAIRMDPSNAVEQDYFLLPWIDVGGAGRLRLLEENGVFLDAYRFETLDKFFHLTRRFNLKAAA